MAGITSVEVKESLDEIASQLRQAKTPKAKERLQVLFWLKQEKPPSISAIAKASGKHRKQNREARAAFEQTLQPTSVS